MHWKLFQSSSYTKNYHNATTGRGKMIKSQKNKYFKLIIKRCVITLSTTNNLVVLEQREIKIPESTKRLG